jgi:hypothetical protein
VIDRSSKITGLPISLVTLGKSQRNEVKMFSGLSQSRNCAKTFTYKD